MALINGPRDPRFVFRYAVRLRREGGSLTATIPRYIVKKWQLRAGDALLVQSTKWGLLLRPRFLNILVRPDEFRTLP